MAKFDLIIKHNNANEDDVINLVIRTAIEQQNSNEVLAFFDLYPLKNFPNKYNWLKLLFNLIQKISTYGNDSSGVEEIKTPKRFLFVDKFGDCDDYSTLWAAILLQANIKFFIKLVKYDINENWAHVYVIVPAENGKYITLDNVNPAGFDKEVQHVEHKIYQAK